MAELPPEIENRSREWIEDAAVQVSRLVNALGALVPNCRANFRLALVLEDETGGRVTLMNDENDISELLERKT